MFFALFMNSVFSNPVKPDGWEKRTDAKPYLSPAANGSPQIAEPLNGRAVEPGWDMHVRTTPSKDKDDWRARLPVTSVPTSFREHLRKWPSDDWVFYQMLGRITVTAGQFKFGVTFATADPGIGCFVDLRIGGASVVQADTVKFFSQRKAKSTERDEITLTGDIKLEPGEYDAVATLGCHPGKMGEEIKLGRLDAWKNSRFAFVIQKPSESLRLMRSSEVVHLQ